MAKRTGKVRKEIFYSEADWEVIQRRANLSKMDTTKYIRKMTLEGNMVIYDLKDISNLICSIYKIGVNVNQVAQKVNITNEVYKQDLESLQKDYYELCSVINKFFICLKPSNA